MLQFPSWRPPLDGIIKMGISRFHSSVEAYPLCGLFVLQFFSSHYLGTLG
jgi:hypothetical protein